MTRRSCKYHLYIRIFQFFFLKLTSFIHRLENVKIKIKKNTFTQFLEVALTDGIYSQNVLENQPPLRKDYIIFVGSVGIRYYKLLN